MSESPQVGERCLEQTGSESASAMGTGNAGGTEKSEGAVVGVVGGESGDRSVDLEVEQRGRVVLERAPGLESPDAAELFLDERQDPLTLCVRRAEHSFWHCDWKLRGDEVLRRCGDAVATLQEKIDRRRIALNDARREVVSGLGRHNLRAAACLRLVEERTSDAAPAAFMIDSQNAKRPSAGHADAGNVAEDAHIRCTS